MLHGKLLHQHLQRPQDDKAPDRERTPQRKQHVADFNTCGERLPDSQTLSMISALRTVRAIGLPGSRKYAACARASSKTPPGRVSVLSFADKHIKVLACISGRLQPCPEVRNQT